MLLEKLMTSITEITKKVAIVLFKNVIGITLIPILFVGYYLVDNTILQLLILTILFATVRVNIHGKRLHLIKDKSE